MFGPALPPAMRKARAAARKAAKAPKASKSMVSLIKHIAAKETLKELETKFVSVTSTNAFNAPINLGYQEMYSLIPAVGLPPSGQAAPDHQRANNDITPISCRTHWTVALTPTARSMNIIAVLYCLQSKTVRNYKNFPDIYPVSGGGPRFLKSGNAFQLQGFDGLIASIDLPVNIENFTLLHKKTFHLCGNVGLPNDDTTAGNAPNVSQRSGMQRHTYTYKCPKQFRYTPTLTDVYPDGHAPFWVMGYCHVDGTAVDNANQDITVTATTQMTFKDA